MNYTLYKIDLNAVSLQAIALNNGSFLPLSGIYLPFISKNKIIATNYNDAISGDYGRYGGYVKMYYLMDINNGINPQGMDSQLEMLGQITLDEDPFSDFPEYSGTSPVQIHFIRSILLQDLAGTPWLYTHYGKGESNFYTGLVIAGWQINKFLTTSFYINETGQLIGELMQKGTHTLTFPGDYSGFFLLNSGNIKRTNQINNFEFYHSNGIIITYNNSIIKLTRKAVGINVESIALDFPSVTEEKSFINSDNYLFWLDGNTIKRLWLGTGGTEEIIYTNIRIIDNAPNRNLLISSGRNLIFYQYAEDSVTEVHTYSLDMYNPNAQPIILDSNDMDIIKIVELDFNTCFSTWKHTAILSVLTETSTGTRRGKK